MRVHTPTSVEQTRRYIDISDILSILIAAPIALALRDPNLFAVGNNTEALIYSSVAFVVGGLIAFAFNLGKNVRGFISMNEVQSVVLAALSAVSVTALIVFSFTRLDFVPRTVPLIHVLVLASFMLTARAIATKWRRHSERRKRIPGTDPSHILLIGSNQLAWSYLRMLNVLDMGRSDVVAILDDDPKLFGRMVLGCPVLAPTSELSRVVHEYAVHGVQINRVLIAANQRAEASDRKTVEEYCQSSNISVGFLGDILGVDLGQPLEALPAVKPPTHKIGAYPRIKRVFDFSIALVVLIISAPFFAIFSLGVLIDLGWPITFWQKRDGKDGEPFLIYKIRTMQAPFDRGGRFVEESRRASRFGDFLRRMRLDEWPQLWNVLTGDMSFVGPRPLLPVDQPSTSKRLQVPPGLTGWAQIHGGKRVEADEKGLLDDWYVEHASFWLDVSIIFRTVSIVIFGDDRIKSRSTLGSARTQKTPVEPQTSLRLTSSARKWR
jgi:lipopolysaccharide/colanic/teichoic acid biosynthesis glycosyltransferase